MVRAGRPPVWRRAAVAAAALSSLAAAVGGGPVVLVLPEADGPDALGAGGEHYTLSQVEARRRVDALRHGDSGMCDVDGCSRDAEVTVETVGGTCSLPQKLFDEIEAGLAPWCAAAAAGAGVLSVVAALRYFSQRPGYAVWLAIGGELQPLAPPPITAAAEEGNAAVFVPLLRRAVAALGPDHLPLLWAVSHTDLPRQPRASAECAALLRWHGARLPDTSGGRAGAPPRFPALAPAAVPGCHYDLLYPSVSSPASSSALDDPRWDEKEAGAIWRGSAHEAALGPCAASAAAADAAAHDLEVPRNHRLRFVEAARAAFDSCDAAFLGNGSGVHWDRDAAGRWRSERRDEAVPAGLAAPRVDAAALASRRIALDADGVSWTGRTAQLLAANCTVALCVLHQDLLHRMLSPWVHYAPVRMDGRMAADARRAARLLQREPAVARRLASQGRKAVLRASEDLWSCYTARLVLRYSQCTRWVDDRPPRHR